MSWQHFLESTQRAQTSAAAQQSPSFILFPQNPSRNGEEALKNDSDMEPSQNLIGGYHCWDQTNKQTDKPNQSHNLLRANDGWECWCHVVWSVHTPREAVFHSDFVKFNVCEVRASWFYPWCFFIILSNNNKNLSHFSGNKFHYSKRLWQN